MSAVSTLTASPARPGLRTFATATAGLLALGGCAALGMGELDLALRTLPSAAFITLGAAVLTSPALLVAHQVMGMAAPPEELVSSLMRALARMGQVSAGLSPFVLYFSVTSGLSPALFTLAFLAGGALTAGTAMQELTMAEKRHGGSAAAAVPMAGVSTAWIGLTALIALRLTFGLFGGL